MRTRNLVVLVGISHIVAALGIIGTQIALARTLPAAVFGTFLLVQAIAALVEGLIVARAGEVAIFELGRSTNDLPRMAALAAALRRREWVWGIAAYAVVAVLAPAFEAGFDVAAQCYWILAASVPLQAGYGVSKALFIVTDNLRAQALFEISYSFVTFAIVVTGAVTGGLYGCLAASVLAACVKSAVASRLTRAYLPHPSDAKDAVVTKGVSTLSLFRNACNHVANQADVLILGALAPKEAVAYYKVARTLSALPGRAAGPIWATLRPRFVRQIADGHYDSLLAELRRYGMVIGGLGLALSPLVFLASSPFLRTVYGQSYAQAEAPLLILLLGTWSLGAVTGWLGTLSIMTTQKPITIGIYAMLATLIVAGSFLARGDRELTAAAVSAAMVAAALFAWMWVARAGAHAATARARQVDA